MDVIAASERPPAQPSWILRGHVAQIHAVHFFRRNSRLITGDADGWVIVWNTTSKRAVAVWQAHKSTILGLGRWQDDKILTHGRDNKLHVWQLKADDERGLSTVYPIDDASTKRKSPWLLHTLIVNTLNFCAFASSPLPSPSPSSPPTLLIATPGVQDGHVNLTLLPSESRHSTVPSPPNTETGMLMAVSLHVSPSDPSILSVLTGYESGHVSVWRQLRPPPSTSFPTPPTVWTTVYLSKPHSQPALSIAVAPSLGCFYSSSADAIIAQHPIPTNSGSTTSSSIGSSIATTPDVVLRSGHAGQQSLTVRSGGTLSARGGGFGGPRVYATTEGLREVAVLKWHKEGCYAVAFADVGVATDGDESVKGRSRGDGGGDNGEKDGKGMAVQHQPRMTVSALRTRAAETTHWIAAGSKDGKVSLWDIY